MVGQIFGKEHKEKEGDVLDFISFRSGNEQASKKEDFEIWYQTPVQKHLYKLVTGIKGNK